MVIDVLVYTNASCFSISLLHKTTSTCVNVDFSYKEIKCSLEDNALWKTAVYCIGLE